MPPKAKFTKREIADAALRIIRENGVENLTARTLGKRLGSSACPIFTRFETMDEVFEEAVKAAKSLYSEYVAEGLKEPLAFKGVGMKYIEFAVKEPNLFRLLFMAEHTDIPTTKDVLPAIDDNYQAILRSVEKSFGLNADDSKELYKHLWIYTHGIATLCATDMCTFTEEEIGNLLTVVCMAVLKEIKGRIRHD